MKKYLIILFALLLMIMFIGCKSEHNDNNMLLSVLKNEQTFIDKNGNSVLLKDYVISKELKTTIENYTFVDMDSDGNDEAIVYLSPDYGAYLVLHASEKDIFGYEFYARALQDLKENGSFHGSGGAATGTYSKMLFIENSYCIIEEMFYDNISKEYRLNGKKSSQSEYEKFIENRNNEKDVKWHKYTFGSQEGYSPEKVSSKPKTETQTICLNDYIQVNFERISGAGHATISLDKEQFFLDNINKINFKNAEVALVYNKLYGTTSALDAIWTMVNNISLDKTSQLSNGDHINAQWNIDLEKISNYFDIKLVFSNKSIKVSGLKEPKRFNPMTYVTVTFSGKNGEGIASLVAEKIPYYGMANFELSKHSGLSNGDIVTVNYKIDERFGSLSYFIAQYEAIPEVTEKNFVVSGLE